MGRQEPVHSQVDPFAAEGVQRETFGHHDSREEPSAEVQQTRQLGICVDRCQKVWRVVSIVSITDPNVLHISQDPLLPRIPIIGNGDILSWEDWRDHQHLLHDRLRDEDPEAIGLTSCAMIARGALVKPWLPREIKESRHIDMPAPERLDMLKTFCNYGNE